jgi:hypothetical protein
VNRIGQLGKGKVSYVNSSWNISFY